LQKNEVSAAMYFDVDMENHHILDEQGVHLW